jgi:DNA polymerase
VTAPVRHELLAGTAVSPLAHVLHIDLETRGVLDLRKVGTQKYAADPRTEITLLAYAVDDGPVQVLRPKDDPIPEPWIEAANDPGWIVVAHNASFEIALMRCILHPRHGFPIIPIERFRCTQAAALRLALPARLGRLADALEFANRKDAAGERLMHQMSKPRRARKDEDAGAVHWFDDEERVQRLGGYNAQDVEVEREAHDELPALPQSEQQNWLLSCRINDRGFRIDRPLVEAMRRIAQAAAPEIDAEIATITGGAVTGINQIARLLTWLKAHGYAAKSLKAAAVEQQLAKEDLSPEMRRALELRLGGAQAAVKKLDAALAWAGDDDRVCGAFVYHGAATGRWSSTGLQVHNLKRPEVEDVDAAIAAVRTGDYQHVRARYPRPLAVIGDVLHAMLIPATGCEFVGADFATIEARVLAWLAGEDWKLDQFRRYDATGNFEDHLYARSAASALRLAPSSIRKGTPEYHIGKVRELAFGYQGGVRAWRQFDPDRFTDEEVLAQRNAWRAEHPAIRRFWYDVDRAARLAVRERGQLVAYRCLRFKCGRGFLQMQLPSGRRIAYPQPRIIEDDQQRQSVVFMDNALGQWRECRHGDGFYGGAWTENAVSGIARDLLVEAMHRVEAAKYPIVLHVHDELVAEVPLGFGDTQEFRRLMTRRPSWAPDLPIAASAWRGSRYQK